MTVAQTILAQLGGSRFQFMTGAKDFIGSGDTLRFTISRAKDGINLVSIRLDASDTYTIRFMRRSRSNPTDTQLIHESSDVYAEDLEDLFVESTSLYTRFH